MVMKRRGRPKETEELNSEGTEGTLLVVDAPVDIQEIIPPLVVEVQIPQEIEIKKKYLLCPFCQTKQYERSGRDETSSWCIFCGKCFSVIWQEEK